MKKTNFDTYLDQKLKDPAFAKRFAKSDEAWDVAMQIATARKKAGISQKELAARLKTSQQQVSRLESPSYRGHSLQTLERVAGVLGAKVRVTFESNTASSRVQDPGKKYSVRKKSSKKTNKRALTRTGKIKN